MLAAFSVKEDECGINMIEHERPFVPDSEYLKQKSSLLQAAQDAHVEASGLDIGWLMRHPDQLANMHDIRDLSPPSRDRYGIADLEGDGILYLTINGADLTLAPLPLDPMQVDKDVMSLARDPMVEPGAVYTAFLERRHELLPDKPSAKESLTWEQQQAELRHVTTYLSAMWHLMWDNGVTKFETAQAVHRYAAEVKAFLHTTVPVAQIDKTAMSLELARTADKLELCVLSTCGIGPTPESREALAASRRRRDAGMLALQESGIDPRQLRPVEGNDFRSVGLPNHASPHERFRTSEAAHNFDDLMHLVDLPLRNRRPTISNPLDEN